MTKLTDNRPQSIKFRAHKDEVLKAITSAVGGITAVAVVAMFPEVGPDTTRKAITRLRGEKLVYIDKWLYTPHGSPPMRLKAGNKPDAPRLVKPPRQKLGPRVSIAAVDRKVLLAVKNSADTAKKVAEKTGLELWRAKESLCRLREKGAVMYDRGLGINRWRLAGHPEHFRTPSIRPLVAMRTTFAGGFNPWQGL